MRKRHLPKVETRGMIVKPTTRRPNGAQDVSLIDVLRTAVSMAGHFDPVRGGRNRLGHSSMVPA